MTFADARKTTFYATVLGGQFSEVVAFYPSAGAARSVTGIVQTNRGRQNDEPAETDVERLWLHCGRDESHVKGGIERPEIGDTLVLDSDPAGRERWAFTGEVEDQTAYAHRLRFERHRTKTIGTRGN
jgi:hypothetical protein